MGFQSMCETPQTGHAGTATWYGETRLGSRAAEFSVTSECRTYGASLDFLWTLAALANFMRVSSQKAAHAVLDGTTYRKSWSGSSSIDAPALPALG